MLVILKKTWKQWLGADPFTYSASAAYYAVFSMPGLLMVVTAVAAVLFDRAAIEHEILEHARTMFGRQTAENFNDIVESTQRNDRDILAMIIGTLTLIFGATGVFVQLQRALNHIWQVEIKKNAGMIQFLKNRASALGVTIAIGFLLLVSMVVTSLIAALSDTISSYFSISAVIVLQVLDLIVSLGIISGLFAIMFRLLPDVHLKWRHALSGGVVSAILFNLGEYGLTLYFNMAEPESAFGAAGSIVLFMIWVFYACVIFLFGANFTRIHALEDGESTKVNELARKKVAKK